MFQIFKIKQHASERVSPARGCTLNVPDLNSRAGYETPCTPKTATNNGLLHIANPRLQTKIKT